MAIGVPLENVDTITESINFAGAVNVLYGSSNGLSATTPRADQFWTQNTKEVNDVAEDGDQFGSSLAAADFNGDGFDDLAIGVPGEDLVTGAGTISGAGAVNVLYGSSNGLSATSPIPDQFWTQDTPNVDDVAEEDEILGISLSAGDFNGDKKDDLAIGVPREPGGAREFLISNAGAVNILYGSSNGLSAISPRADQIWTQNSLDVDDVAEAFDEFGMTLSAGDFNGDGKDDLAIGAHYESLVTGAGTISGAGAVNVLYGSSNGLSATSPIPDQFWTQDTPNVDDVAEEGDFFGDTISSGDFNADGKDDLAIGLPQEDVKTQTAAGAINVLYGSSNGLSATTPRADQFWEQDSTDVNDVAESFDNLGSSIFAADFNGDGKDDLAIGVVYEDVRTAAGIIAQAGAVNVIYGSSTGLSATSPIPDQFLTQDTPNVDDIPEELDTFGSSLSAADFNGDGRDDVAIGAPTEDLSTGAETIHQAGAVNVIYGSSNGLSPTSPRPDQFWSQNSPNVNDFAEPIDRFGLALG